MGVARLGSVLTCCNCAIGARGLRDGFGFLVVGATGKTARFSRISNAKLLLTLQRTPPKSQSLLLKAAKLY